MIKRFKMLKQNVLPLIVGGAIVVSSSGCGKMVDSSALEKEALSTDNEKAIYEMSLDFDVSEQDKVILNDYEVSEIKDVYKDTTSDLVDELIFCGENEQYENIVHINSKNVSEIYDLYVVAKESASEEDINKLMGTIRNFLEDPEKEELALSIPVIMASADLSRNSDCSFTDKEIKDINENLGNYVSDVIDNKCIMNVWQNFVSKQLGKENIQYPEILKENEELITLYNQLEAVLKNTSDEEVKEMSELERQFINTSTKNDLILASPIIFTGANITRNSDYSLSDEELDDVRDKIKSK